MADVKWIKIVTDIFDDDKILLIESMPEADAIIVIWFKLLCLAGKQNNSGVFLLNGRIAYTDEMFATIFRRPINTVRLALKTFEQFGMIEIVNNTITIPNWGKHQNFDRIEAKTEYMRGYMQEYRKKQKALSDGKSNSKSNSKANVSEADKIREDKNRLDKSIYNDKEDNAHTREDNPFGEVDDSRPRTDTVQAYASNNLMTLGYRAMEELNSFVDDLSEDIVRHAIDNALDNGVRNWSYVRAILNQYVEQGVKSVGDAKTVDESRKKGGTAKGESAQADTDEDHRPRAVIPDRKDVEYVRDENDPMGGLKMYVIRRTGEEVPWSMIRAMCPGEIERFWDSRGVGWHN